MSVGVGFENLKTCAVISLFAVSCLAVDGVSSQLFLS